MTGWDESYFKINASVPVFFTITTFCYLNIKLGDCRVLFGTSAL